MAKKKRKSNKRDPEAALRNKRIAIGSAIVIGGGAVFVGTALGVAELDERAAELTNVTTRGADGGLSVEIVYPADADGQIWIPRSEIERINRRATDAVRGMRALSGAPLEEVGRVLAATGWAEGMPDVRWTSDGRIVAKVSWRAPVAAVRMGSSEVLIDRNANLLPLEYPIGESNQYYLINASGAVPRIGQPWGGTDIRDGLALLELLRAEDLLEQITGIDLGVGQENGSLMIHTDGNAKIIWGGGPGHDRPGEQPTGVKTNRLKALYGRTGRIDAGLGFLDIRGPSITKLREE